MDEQDAPPPSLPAKGQIVHYVMPDGEPDSPAEDYRPSRRAVLIDRAIIVGTMILILILVGAVILMIRSSL